MIKKLLIASLITNSALVHSPVALAFNEAQLEARDRMNEKIAEAEKALAAKESAEFEKQVLSLMEAKDAQSEKLAADAIGSMLVKDAAWYKYFSGLQLESMSNRVKQAKTTVDGRMASLNEADFIRKIQLLDEVVTAKAGEVALESEESRRNLIYFSGLAVGTVLSAFGAHKVTGGSQYWLAKWGLRPILFMAGFGLSYWISSWMTNNQAITNFATKGLGQTRQDIDRVFGTKAIAPATLSDSLLSTQQFTIEQQAIATWGQTGRQILSGNVKTNLLLGNVAFEYGQKIKFAKRAYQKLYSFEILTDVDHAEDQNVRIAHVEMQTMVPLDNTFEIQDRNGTLVAKVKAVYDIKRLSRLYEVYDASGKLIASSDNSNLFNLDFFMSRTDDGTKVVDYKTNLIGQGGIARGLQQLSKGNKVLVGDKWAVSISSHGIDRRVILALPVIKSLMDDTYFQMAHAGKDALVGIGKSLLKK